MNFTWSWSRLKNYRACPKRHWEIDLQRNFKEEEGDALKWGNRVHEAMAKRLEKKQPLPDDMKPFEEWPELIETLSGRGSKILVENKLAMTREFGPTGFFDKDVWFRAVVDVLILPTPSVAITYDWKTGKVAPEMEQLMLSAQVVFAHYPEVQQVGARYVWLGMDDCTDRIYKRDEMVPYWNDLMPSVNVMAEAFRTTTYPPKPSGLCKRHCPVTSCPHHGKGSY